MRHPLVLLGGGLLIILRHPDVAQISEGHGHRIDEVIVLALRERCRLIIRTSAQSFTGAKINPWLNSG